MNRTTKLAYVWDYDIDEDSLKEILAGRLVIGRLNKKWAVRRILEYAPYPEIIRLLGYRGISEQWPELRESIRSQARKRGFDFLVEWLKENRPEKL